MSLRGTAGHGGGQHDGTGLTQQWRAHVSCAPWVLQADDVADRRRALLCVARHIQYNLFLAAPTAVAAVAGGIDSMDPGLDVPVDMSAMLRMPVESSEAPAQWRHMASGAGSVDPLIACSSERDIAVDSSVSFLHLCV